MKKVLSVFTIVLLCIVGVVYYCFFLDGRVFLKNNTENLVSHLKSVPTGEEFDLSVVCCPADSVYVVEPYNAEFFEQNSHLEIISKAKKLFGDKDPIGKTIVAPGDKTYTVTGVMKDLPTFSHVRFDILASLSTREITEKENSRRQEDQ